MHPLGQRSSDFFHRLHVCQQLVFAGSSGHSGHLPVVPENVQAPNRVLVPLSRRDGAVIWSTATKQTVMLREDQIRATRERHVTLAATQTLTGEMGRHQ